MRTVHLLVNSSTAYHPSPPATMRLPVYPPPTSHPRTHGVPQHATTAPFASRFHWPLHSFFTYFQQNSFPFLSFHFLQLLLIICAADRMGPDDLLIRINEELVLAWLSAKVGRATKRFVELASMGVEESRWGGGGSAGGAHDEGFAGDFQAIPAPTDAASRRMEVEAESKQHALEAVCEYLSEEWATKLAEKFRLSTTVYMLSFVSSLFSSFLGTGAGRETVLAFRTKGSVPTVEAMGLRCRGIGWCVRPSTS